MSAKKRPEPFWRWWIARNPVAFVEKPPMEVREMAAGPADFERVMATVAAPSFRDRIRFNGNPG